MSRRRSEFNMLQPSKDVRWLVVRTAYGRVLSARLLPPGSHVQREFVASILAYIDGGWTVGDFSSVSAYYVATRSPERVEVTITSLDPHEPQKPMYGHRY